jgi:hypothetical protein
MLMSQMGGMGAMMGGTPDPAAAAGGMVGMQGMMQTMMMMKMMEKMGGGNGRKTVSSNDYADRSGKGSSPFGRG